MQVSFWSSRGLYYFILFLFGCISQSAWNYDLRVLPSPPPSPHPAKASVLLQFYDQPIFSLFMWSLICSLKITFWVWFSQYPVALFQGAVYLFLCTKLSPLSWRPWARRWVMALSIRARTVHFCTCFSFSLSLSYFKQIPSYSWPHYCGHAS